MFITDKEIQALKDAETDERVKSAIGERFIYHYLFDEGKGVCGLPIVITGMRKDTSHEDPKGPFYLDFAIPTPVEGFYTHHKDIRVNSAHSQFKDGTEHTTFAKDEEIPRIMEIINSRSRPTKLRLVPKN